MSTMATTGNHGNMIKEGWDSTQVTQMDIFHHSKTWIPKVSSTNLKESLFALTQEHITLTNLP